jgi:hypothetical protein
VTSNTAAIDAILFLASALLVPDEFSPFLSRGGLAMLKTRSSRSSH